MLGNMVLVVILRIGLEKLPINNRFNFIKDQTTFHMVLMMLSNMAMMMVLMRMNRCAVVQNPFEKSLH